MSAIGGTLKGLTSRLRAQAGIDARVIHYGYSDVTRHIQRYNVQVKVAPVTAIRYLDISDADINNDKLTGRIIRLAKDARDEIEMFSRRMRKTRHSAQFGH